MDGDIIARIDEEEADLLRKLKAIQEFKAAYGVRSVEGAAVDSRKSNSRSRVSIEGFGKYGRTVVAEAMRFLLFATTPMKTRELVPNIEAMGVNINGENKINALGALLARSIDIVSHGKAGWTLADKERARVIVAEHGHNETEAPSGEAAGASEVPPASVVSAGWTSGPYSSRPPGAGESE